MKTKFSKTWIKSKQPRKQKKYVANAPLHIKRKLLVSRLSKELTQKYGKRNMVVREGDIVKVVRGGFKDHSGKIESVITKRLRVFIEGVETIKRDGNKSYYPVHPSNLIITELNLEDKQRQKILERVVKQEIKNEQKAPKKD